jgi:hypothetical protein
MPVGLRKVRTATPAERQYRVANTARPSEAAGNERAWTRLWSIDKVKHCQHTAQMRLRCCYTAAATLLLRLRLLLQTFRIGTIGRQCSSLLWKADAKLCDTCRRWWRTAPRGVNGQRVGVFRRFR